MSFNYRRPPRRRPFTKPTTPPVQPRYEPPVEPWAQTRPQAVSPERADPTYRPPAPAYRPPATPPYRRPRRRLRFNCGCLVLLAILAGIVGVILGVYFLAPGRTNILLLGIDYTEPGSSVARSDTIILTTIIPMEPYVGMLSVPRDLWVPVPGVGENRINTAHFFAEATQPGSGPAAAMLTVEQNFGVDVDYYARIRFEGVREIVNAMGGLELELTEPMAGYPPGVHHLTGNKALAFARNRSGADDFFRMQNGQFLIKAIIRQMLRPRYWLKLPAVASAALRSVDTNVPTWLWPRLGLALLRAGPDGIDSRTVSREMTTSFITNEGASVLLPNWALINPVLKEMFGQ